MKYRYLMLWKFCYKKRVVTLYLNEGDKWLRYYFFKVATTGCLIISLSICYHKWNDLPQFWNDFSLSHLSDILFYVRGLRRSISKKKVVGVQYDQTKLVLILHSFHTVTSVLFDIKCRKSMFRVWEHMKCPKTTLIWYLIWNFITISCVDKKWS